MLIIDIYFLTYKIQCVDIPYCCRAFQTQDTAQVEMTTEQAELSEACSSADAPAVDQPGNVGPEQTPSSEEESLTFVAGYIAFKCRDIDPTLGRPTYDMQSSSSVPDAWVRAVNRGALYVPSDHWMAIVGAFDARFKATMGSGVDSQPGIIRRLMSVLLLMEPDLDRRVARKHVTTRLFIRLRYLNRGKLEVTARRRSQNQTKQHCRSQRH